MPSLTATYTNPPRSCDLCSTPIGSIFYDVRLPRYGGTWANVCPTCFEFEGPGQLGTGLGQKYQRQADGSFLKTGG